MGATFDQMKMINTLRKAQKDLKNEIVEVEAGDGAVVVQITGELKVKKVSIDPSRIDLDDISELERWIENCFRDGYADGPTWWPLWSRHVIKCCHKL